MTNQSQNTIRTEVKWIYFVVLTVAGVMGPFFMLRNSVSLNTQAVENLTKTVELQGAAISSLERSNATLQASFEFYHGRKD